MQNGFLDTKDFSRAATFVVTLFCVSGGGGDITLYWWVFHPFCVFVKLPRIVR